VTGPRGLNKNTVAMARMRRDGVGQGLAEYAVTLALIALVAIVAVLFLGGEISALLGRIGGAV